METISLYLIWGTAVVCCIIGCAISLSRKNRCPVCGETMKSDSWVDNEIVVDGLVCPKCGHKTPLNYEE